MKKVEFLDELCQALRFCSSADEIQRTVNFYSEAIDDRMEDGMSEEEAVAAMGSIDDIVREVVGSWHPENEETPGAYHVRPGEVRRLFSPNEVTRIDVYDTSGNICVLPSTDGNIHIEYTATDTWRYDITGESVITVRRAKNTVQEERLRIGLFGKEFSIPLPNFNGAFTSELRLKILLPMGPGPAVSVNSASGDVECRNVSPAELYVKLASGDVTVENTQSDGKTSLITVSGEVEIRNLTAPEVTVTTVSGDIDLIGLQAAQLGLKSVSGDTKATDLAVTERVNAGSVSGDIDLVLTVPCERVSADSVSGDVELDLAGPDSLYTVTTKTSSGDVNVSGAPSAGPNQVRVKTMSGDIDVDFWR